MTWRSKAACLGLDPQIFHALEADELRNAAAKAVCATCPVVTRCLDYALEEREKEGVWGGHTALERRRLKRRTDWRNRLGA